VACQSRLVDCRRLESFTENWSQARERYETDASLLSIPFGEADHALKTVVGLIETEEKAAATGDPATTQEFIRRAKAGYYEALKAFPDRQARREWKRRFKQEMRAHRDRWRHQWQDWQDGPAPLHPGLGLTLPLLSLLHGAVKILWLCALVSLLATGAVFGLALPAGLPPWVAVLLLFLLYGILAGPLQAARRARHWGLGRARPFWALIFLLDAAVWLAVAVVLFCLACHYFPELSAAVGNLPDLMHKALDDIRNWWPAK